MRYTPAVLDHRYIVIEGPPGVGKTALAERLAARFDASAVLEDAENPFLQDFYAERPGSAFQTQLFFLLSRHRQQLTLRQADLFSQTVVSDCLFERDRVYAYLHLDDNELFIYQRLYDLLAQDVPSPDLVVYLQAPTESLVKRQRERGRDPEHPHRPSADHLKKVNEAYQHFFFHHQATPLLVVETSQVDLVHGDTPLEDLVRQIRAMGGGTRYYVPRTT